MNNRWIKSLPLWLALALMAHLAYMLYAYEAGYYQRIESWITDIDGTRNGLLASASDNQIRLWQQRRCLTTLVSPQDQVRCLSFSADGTLLASGGADHSILLWSLPEARPIVRLEAHTKAVTQLLISADHQWLLSQSMDSTLCLWQLPLGKLVRRLVSQPTGFSLSDSGQLAYCDQQANLVLFDLKTQTILGRLPQRRGKPLFSPAGDYLAWLDTASHCTIYKTATQQPVARFSFGDHTNWTFSFTPTGQQLVVSRWGGTVEVWDWRRAKRLDQFTAYTLAGVADLRFDEEGQLQTAGNGSIRYWNLATRERLFSVGDGTYRQTMLSWLSFWVVVMLGISYGVLATAPDAIYARYAILGVLSVWSMGLLILLDQVRSWVISWALGGLWAMASLTLVSLVLYYVWFISLVSIPLGLYFGYVYILSKAPRGWSACILPLLVLLGSVGWVIDSLPGLLQYVHFALG